VISGLQAQTRTPTELNFFLPFRDNKKVYYRMTVTSDTWILDPEYQMQIDLKQISVQGDRLDFTELLDLHPLPRSVLGNQAFQELYP
jgi:hypothetical protein